MISRAVRWPATMGALALALASAAARADADASPVAIPTASSVANTSWTLDGDIGAGADWTQASAPHAPSRTRPIPYVYADDGPLFAREDTFGVKVLPIGWGSLEIAARYSTEGADADGPGLPHRRDPRPVGLGTFQETPWGGVFLDAFVDPVSHGSLLEASYAAELDLGPLTLYPQVGVEHRSARYVDHLFGVPADQAAALDEPVYHPGASTTPVLGLSAELAVGGHWVIVGHVQRERYDRAITDSPRVDAAGRTTMLFALTRHFG